MPPGHRRRVITRPFGSTGVAVPVIGQGTWQLRDPAVAGAALRLGLDLGLTHVDTAELYTGSEEVAGRALRDRRDAAFLVTKVLPRNATYRGTLEACRRSLERLATQRLDVYLLHWWEEATPLDECMRAMGELVDAGRTRFVGVSNFDEAQLEAAQSALGPRRIACDQVYYDLAHRHLERSLLPYCRKRGIAVVGYSPFSSTGRVPAPPSEPGRVLAEVAARHGATPHQVVLNFLSRDPGVFLIPKAETEAHVRANASALGFQLDRAEVEALDAAFPVPQRVENLPTI